MAFSLQSAKDEVNAVRIEDDGNVCYAYYVGEENIEDLYGSTTSRSHQRPWKNSEELTHH